MRPHVNLSPEAVVEIFRGRRDLHIPGLPDDTTWIWVRERDDLDEHEVLDEHDATIWLEVVDIIDDVVFFNLKTVGFVIRNAVECMTCNEVIESHHRHDFRYCRCRGIAVDGGHAYRRRVGEGPYVDLSEVWQGPPDVEPTR